MDVEVSSSVIAALIEQAALAAPNEACGILLGGRGSIAALQPSKNIHPIPHSHFEIDPQSLIDAHRSARSGGTPIAGYYHSHPNGRAQPSPTDRAMAAGDGMIWAIVASGAVSWWRDTPVGFEPLCYEVANG